MKKFLVLFALTTASFASEAQVCFTATTRAPLAALQEICLSSVNVNDAYGTFGLLLNRRSAGTRQAQVVAFVRHNEDRARFVMQTELFKPWETGCFVGERATLLLSGMTDVRSSPEVSDLAMTVIYRAPQDTCHNPAYETKIGYAISRTR